MLSSDSHGTHLRFYWLRPPAAHTCCWFSLRVFKAVCFPAQQVLLLWAWVVSWFFCLSVWGWMHSELSLTSICSVWSVFPCSGPHVLSLQISWEADAGAGAADKRGFSTSKAAGWSATRSSRWGRNEAMIFTFSTVQISIKARLKLKNKLHLQHVEPGTLWVELTEATDPPLGESTDPSCSFHPSLKATSSRWKMLSSQLNRSPF